MLRQRVPNILLPKTFDEIEHKFQILNENDTLCALVGNFNGFFTSDFTNIFVITYSTICNVYVIIFAHI
jgi:hypothetical protein